MKFGKTDLKTVVLAALGVLVAGAGLNALRKFGAAKFITNGFDA